MPQGPGSDPKLLRERLAQLKRQRPFTAERAGSFKESQARAAALEAKIAEHEKTLNCTPQLMRPTPCAQKAMLDRMRTMRELSQEP